MPASVVCGEFVPKPLPNYHTFQPHDSIQPNIMLSVIWLSKRQTGNSWVMPVFPCLLILQRSCHPQPTHICSTWLRGSSQKWYGVKYSVWHQRQDKDKIKFFCRQKVWHIFIYLTRQDIIKDWHVTEVQQTRWQSLLFWPRLTCTIIYSYTYHH